MLKTLKRVQPALARPAHLASETELADTAPVSR
jgi:hypothetical protein